MRSVIAAVIYLVVVSVMASACDRDDSEVQPTPVATQIGVRGPKSGPAPIAPAPPPSATAIANETATPPPLQSDDFMPPDPVTGVGGVREALVGEGRFNLEVARTTSERARGLMDRASLPEDAGMLFVYKGEGYLSFWMKNTLIPLDIIFLNALGVVVDVQTMNTQIGVPDGALRLYRSARPARFALEMNAGLAEALGIVPGAPVLFR